MDMLGNGQVAPDADTALKQNPPFFNEDKVNSNTYGKNHNKLKKTKSYEETGANTNCPEGRSSPREQGQNMK